MTNTLDSTLPVRPRGDSVALAARSEGASKIYGSGDTAVHALRSVDVGFRAGEFTAIMGPSGSGKSTLMQCMAGLDRLTGGRTFIGGVDLSSGQWRRLAFARSMFRHGDLVVLDEPSTALDPEAEGRLVDVIEAGLADRTALVVSHRWSTVRLADRIYVLDEGRVVEEGSHADLVSRGGLYASLFEAQAGQFR